MPNNPTIALDAMGGDHGPAETVRGAAIAAAKAAGNGAKAYFPSGTYVVNDTVHISGSGYTVGGSGC